jgi:hypothetical protein
LEVRQLVIATDLIPVIELVMARPDEVFGTRNVGVLTLRPAIRLSLLSI